MSATTRPKTFCDKLRDLRPKTRERRPSSTQRGYDRLWYKVRNRFKKANPLCRLCKLAGRIVPASVVDHRVPISEGGARLDPANLQSLCKPCHDHKTATEDGGFGRPKRKHK